MRLNKILLAIAIVLLIFSVPTAGSVAQTPGVCGYETNVAEILGDVTQADIVQWIRNFSGADSVRIAGILRTIKTRYSPQLFSINPDAMAYSYLHQELLKMGYEYGTTLTDHSYSGYKYYTVARAREVEQAPYYYEEGELGIFDDYIPDEKATWQNKVVTIPGHGPNADEIVLMTAHLDSTSNAASTNAPGAEDNASGVSALMEAARLFPYYKFDRTIKIIFFTGEEQGLYGSEAYVSDHPAEMNDIIGVVNLDMFGYDSNQDMCIELHVGLLPDSNTVGSCFTNVNTNYNLGLQFDFLTSNAEEYSDHSSFWDAGVGAIEVLENYSTKTSAGGCGGIADRNPHYHKTTDTIDKMYLPATVSTARAGIATVASLAGPLGKCFTIPKLTATPQADSILLSWPAIAGADVYNVYRGTATCGGTFTQIGEVSSNSFEDTEIEFDKNYFYKIQAAETEGVCFSEYSNCTVVRVSTPPEPPPYTCYLPMIGTVR